jgi:hypothetical protein
MTPERKPQTDSMEAVVSIFVNAPNARNQKYDFPRPNGLAAPEGKVHFGDLHHVAN